jgi:hypothetical protein
MRGYAAMKVTGGGYAYRDYDDFQTIVHNIDRARGPCGRNYVAQNYS